MEHEVCQYFQQGKCRYGSNCSKQHILVCELLDPPTWIFTFIENLKLNIISQEELRYSLKINDIRRILDDMWFENYAEMYITLNNICKRADVKSTTRRCVDLRKHPECFNLPFDIKYVEQKIVKLMEKEPISLEYKIIQEDEESTTNLDVENAPSFVKEYAYKKEAYEIIDKTELESNNESSIHRDDKSTYTSGDQKSKYNYLQTGQQKNEMHRTNTYQQRSDHQQRGDYNTRQGYQDRSNYTRGNTNDKQGYQDRLSYNTRQGYQDRSNYNRGDHQQRSDYSTRQGYQDRSSYISKQGYQDRTNYNTRDNTGDRTSYNRDSADGRSNYRGNTDDRSGYNTRQGYQDRSSYNTRQSYQDRSNYRGNTDDRANYKSNTDDRPVYQNTARTHGDNRHSPSTYKAAPSEGRDWNKSLNERRRGDETSDKTQNQREDKTQKEDDGEDFTYKNVPYTYK